MAESCQDISLGPEEGRAKGSGGVFNYLLMGVRTCARGRGGMHEGVAPLASVYAGRRRGIPMSAMTHVGTTDGRRT